MTKLRDICKRISVRKSSPRYSRLEGDLSAYEIMLQRRVEQHQSQDEEWAKRAKELLEQTRRFMEEDRKIDEAWKSFHAARRLEYFGMTEEERKHQGDTIRQEAGKFNEWRKKSVHSILPPASDRPYTPEALASAAEIKDEHYHNLYYKNRVVRQFFNLLFLLLIITLGLIFLFVFYCGNKGNCDLSGDLTCHNYVIGVVLFGFLGAITSSILFTRKKSQRSGIIEISQNNVVTLSKLFVAAGFSVFIFILLRSTLAESIDILSNTISTPADYFTVAFLSGFSERYAEKTVGKFVSSGGQQEEEKE